MTRRRVLANRLATAWMLLSVGLVLVPLIAILGYCVSRGAGAISWEFLSSATPSDISSSGGGFWNGIKGTLKLILVSALMAVPVGILAALYLDEYGRGSRFAGLVRFVTNLIAGVPSVFMGVFVYSLVVLHTGYSALSGALALALLMLPIIVRGSEEVLRLVPRDLREASLALGATRARTALSVTLPAAASGIVTAVMLAVARAAGETAPLLFTSFGNNFVTGWGELDEPDSALPLLIFRNAGSAYPAARERAWAGALVLIALVLVLTILARFVTGRRAAVPAA